MAPSVLEAALMEISFHAHWAPRVLSILRVVTAVLYMQHGSQKLFGFPFDAAHTGSPPLDTLMWISGVLELFGGLLVLVGLFTRPVAFVLSGHMAAAYFMAHAPDGFWPILNNGDLAVLFCFVFLYLSVAGGGTWSLDAWRRSAASPGAGGG